MENDVEEKTQVSTEKTAGGEVVTKRRTTSNEHTNTFQAYYLVYYIVGLLEVLLAFRFVFKLLGANPGSGFVSFIYSLTNALVAPFNGIFQTATTTGAETTAVLEPATIVAMIVYALVGWGIAKLIGVTMAGKS